MLPSGTQTLLFLLSICVIKLSFSSSNETQIFYSAYPNIIYQYIVSGLTWDYYLKGYTAPSVDDVMNKNTVRFEDERKGDFKITHFSQESSQLSSLIKPTSSSAYVNGITLSEDTGDGDEVFQLRSFGLPSSEHIAFEKTRFFVVTTIFNPASYQSRYKLYHDFAKHMEETGAQLITIECIFPSLNQHEFQVTEPNNPNHIQLKSESVYWMKENLINIAVSKLPSHAKWVCWLDADISFDEPDWIEMTIKLLQIYSVVQVFEKVMFLGPPPENDVIRMTYSFGYSVIHGKVISQGDNLEWYPHPGYGWAMSVEDYRKMNGLPDYNIVGSGDRFFAFSLINKISESFTKNEMTLPLQFTQMISHFANQTFNKLQQLSKRNSKEVVGYVPTTINHHWHGSLKDRQYNDRWKTFKDNNYDFFFDLRKNDHGLFQLNPNKPQLQADIISFFQKRHEDNIDTNIMCQ